MNKPPTRKSPANVETRVTLVMNCLSKKLCQGGAPGLAAALQGLGFAHRDPVAGRHGSLLFLKQGPDTTKSASQ